MKSKYFLILILILAGVLQGIRFLNKGDYFSLEQKHTFTLPKKLNNDIELKDYQKYLVFYSSESELSQKVLENLEEIFKFNKIPYDKVDIKTEVDITPYQNFIFTTDTFLGFRKDVYLSMKDKITKEGGGIFLLTNPPFSPFHKLVGIKELDLQKSYIGVGIKFLKKFFPGLDVLELKDNSLSGYVHKPKLSIDVDIIARDSEDIPIIWKKNLGKGSIVYVNTTIFAERVGRGLMNQIISLESPWYIGITLNSKLVHIDDFPSPIPRYRDEIIYKSYGMETDEFYNQIWWKDMEGLAQRKKLKYSAFLIVDYNDDTDKNLMKDIPEIYLRDLDRRGRNLFIHQGELGIHGYNHNPLVFEGEIDFKSLNYYPWKSEKDIDESLTRLDKVIDDLWGENIEIYSYVPPSNILSFRGKRALYNHYPDLKIISSLFYGESEDGSFITEVGRDKDFSTIHLLPRFSSGFSRTDEKMWNIYNALALYGYFSHFVHPDDILAEDRGYGKDWEQLLREFEGILGEVNDNFPQLEPTLNYELLDKYTNIEDIEIYSKKNKNKIEIEVKNFSSPFKIIFRVKNSKIKDVNSKKYKNMGEYEDTNLYLIEIDREKFEIELEEERDEK